MSPTIKYFMQTGEGRVEVTDADVQEAVDRLEAAGASGIEVVDSAHGTGSDATRPVAPEPVFAPVTQPTLIGRVLGILWKRPR